MRPPHAPRLIPAGETDDGPGQVSDLDPPERRPYSCGHSAGLSPASFSTGGHDRRTLVLPPRYGDRRMLVNPGTVE
jgi:hypothetical protein